MFFFKSQKKAVFCCRCLYIEHFYIVYCKTLQISVPLICYPQCFTYHHHPNRSNLLQDGREREELHYLIRRGISKQSVFQR